MAELLDAIDSKSIEGNLAPGWNPGARTTFFPTAFSMSSWQWAVDEYDLEIDGIKWGAKITSGYEGHDNDPSFSEESRLTILRGRENEI